VSYLAETYRKAAKAKKPDRQRLEAIKGHWRRAVALYDRINAPLPERYQKRLEDRLYERKPAEPNPAATGEEGKAS
jgi:hypothetical protein